MKLLHKDLKLRPMEDWEVMGPNDVEDFERNIYRRIALQELKSELQLDSNSCVVVKFENHPPVVLALMNYNLGRCDCCSDDSVFDNEISSVDIYEYPL